ncbi:unannotated protein [freshwater metagenome]|uniref:Unannotated protein n=1 Tax=freshwater metagenome TaxID=449393 RepID=A0A6J6QBI3_9ZZZZ
MANARVDTVSSRPLTLTAGSPISTLTTAAAAPAYAKERKKFPLCIDTWYDTTAPTPARANWPSES